MAMKLYSVRKRLPTTYYTHIGRLASRWAYLEWRLRRITYALMGASPKHGRIAIRDPRIDDHLTMIEDLIYLEGVKTTADFKGLRTALREVESWRDRVAHGVWVKHSGIKTPVLQDTRGNQPQSFDRNRQARKARINPKAAGITIANFQNWVSVIDAAVNVLDELGKEINAHRKLSRGKPLLLPPDTNAEDPQIQSEEAPQRLPRS